MMGTDAIKRVVGAVVATLVCAGASGCQWETEPASTASSELRPAGYFYDPDETSESACLARERDATREGCPREATGPFPGCGEPFPAEILHRVSCDALQPVGSGECTCRAQGTRCLKHGAEDGGKGCGCEDFGALCDCGDGRGEVYTCGCEGGGDQCGCVDKYSC